MWARATEHLLPPFYLGCNTLHSISGYLPVGASAPLSLASSLLLSSTVSRANWSLEGMMVSSSSNCMPVKWQTKSSFKMRGKENWSVTAAVVKLPVWASGYSQGPRLAPVHVKGSNYMPYQHNMGGSDAFMQLSDKFLTSSRGNSVSWGRELESRPTIKGVGVHTMSSMAGGSTGM